MKTIVKLSYGLATAIAVTLIAVGAHAQTGAPAAGTAAPKAPAAVAKTPAPPAPAGKAEAVKKVDDKKAVVKKAADTKAPVKKGASACAGLEQAACGSNKTCQWIAAVKRKDGRENRAHCRTNAAAAKASVKK